MRRQLGYGGFPAILLTFSLLLLVLAIGFVVGRVVVARAYLKMAPKFDRRPAQEPELTTAALREEVARPRRVNVPPPVPPEEPPEGESEGETEETEEKGVSEPEGGAKPPAPREERQVDAKPVSKPPEVRPPEPRRPVEARVAVPRPVQPVEPEEASGDRYSIQVGVFSTRHGARRAADDLTRAGYAARIEVRHGDTRTLYRVMTGRYQTEYAARKAVEQLRKEGFEAFLVRQ